MKRGINGWTFPRGTPLIDAAQASCAAGFEAFEPALEMEGELSLHSSEQQCQMLGSRIRDLGLEIGSLACGLHWQHPFSSPDPQARQRARDLAVAALDRARWLRAPVLLVVPGVVAHFAEPHRPLCSYADALARTFDALRELSTEAEARGVIIAVENVWNQFLLSPVEMRDLIDHVNSGWVGVYFDVGNVLRFGFPQDWIQTLGRRIVRIHLKDFQLSEGTLKGFCALGDGDVDWPAVMAALHRMRYDGPLTYEGKGDLADIARRIDRITASVAQPPSAATQPPSAVAQPPSAVAQPPSAEQVTAEERHTTGPEE